MKSGSVILFLDSQHKAKSEFTSQNVASARSLKVGHLFILLVPDWRVEGHYSFCSRSLWQEGGGAADSAGRGGAEGMSMSIAHISNL